MKRAPENTITHNIKEVKQSVLDQIETIFFESTNNYAYAEGIKHLRRIQKQYPRLLKSEDFLMKLGLLYDHLAMGEQSTKKAKLEKQALALYQKALTLYPKSYRAWWGIGRIWWHRESKKALPYAKKARALAIQKGTASGLYTQNIGLIYERLGKYKLAERWLLKGLAENPNDWSPYLNIINLYRLTHQFKKARKYAKTLKTLFKKENQKLKKSLWGIKIEECMRNAEKPLTLAKTKEHKKRG